MRKKSAAERVNTLPFRSGMPPQPGVWWGPVIDGVELPRLPLETMRRGESAQVPLIIGTARDGFDHLETSQVT
jgi:hypothetical protein